MFQQAFERQLRYDETVAGYFPYCLMGSEDITKANTYALALGSNISLIVPPPFAMPTPTI